MMLGLFKREQEPDPMLHIIREQEALIAMEQFEYASVVALDVKPSVEGNKVIFDAPELESKIEGKCDGMTFVMHTGSIGLEGNRKVFRNDYGQAHRIEIFQPMRCRLTYA
jgi:hypothetical protein